MAFDTDLGSEDPWHEPDSAEHLGFVQRAAAQWQRFPPEERAWFHLTGVIPYQNIVAIDDTGDEHFEGTHLYIARRSGGYINVFATVEPVRSGTEERYVESDIAEDRVEQFDLSLRARNSKVKIGSNY